MYFLKLKIRIKEYSNFWPGVKQHKFFKIRIGFLGYTEKREDHEGTPGPGRSDTSIFFETESKKGDDQWTRHALYRTHIHAYVRAGLGVTNSSNHQLPIRRVDSWKHGSRSKISGPGMGTPA